MILFTTIEKLKKYVNLNKAVHVDDIQMHLRNAYKRFIEPHFDEAFVVELQSATEPNKIRFLAEIEAVVACFGYHYYLPFLNVQAGGDGLTEGKADNRQAVVKWRFDSTVAASHELAYLALENLYNFWEKNTSIKVFGNPESVFLFKNLASFEQYLDLGKSSYTFFRLLTHLRTVERDHLPYLLGEELWAKIQAEPLKAEYQNLLNLLKPLAAYEVKKSALASHHVQIFGNGFKIVAEDLSQNFPTSENLKIVNVELETQINRKRSEVEKYLLANPTDFPEYQTFKGLDRVESPFFPTNENKLLNFF